MIYNVNANNYDAKKFKVCAPWDSKRGNSWTLVFKLAFEDGCRGQIDQWASWHDLIVTETDFGGANGPAHPGGNLGIQSNAARRTRIQACYSAILLHACQLIGNNERVKAHVANLLTGSPTIAATNAANAAIAAANAAVAAANAQNVAINAANAALVAGVAPQPLVPIPAIPAAAAGVAGQLPDDWLPRLWRWIDTNIGSATQNGILDSNHVTEFEKLKLTDVGINRDTPQLFLDLLNRHNNQRRVSLPIMDLWIKFHQQFKFPRLLADRSIAELLNPSILIPAGLLNAGQPDLPALVSGVYTDVWHTLWDAGIEIKPQAAPEPRAARTGRVDGMHNEQHDLNEKLPAYMSSHIENANNFTELDAYALATQHSENTASSHEFLKNEKCCWSCMGWGHAKQDCPSDKTVRRSRAACIKGLQLLLEQDSSRLKRMQGKRVTRKPGFSPGNRAPRRQPAFQASELDSEEFIQYDDGGVYTTSGDEIVPPVTFAETDPTPLQAQTASVVDSSTCPAKVPAPVSPSTPPVSELEPQAHVVKEVCTDALNPAVIEAKIAQDFAGGHNLHGFSSETVADEYEYYQAAYGKWNIAKAAAAGAACAVALTLGATAIALRSQRARAILTLFAVGTASASATSASAGYYRGVGIKVYASEYSRRQCFDAEPRSRAKAVPMLQREHGIMDSGTSECASGRTKLFPTKLIEQMHPPCQS